MTIKRRSLLLLASAAAATKAYGQANIFTYYGPPTVSSVSPNPAGVGVTVTLTGNNFTLASSVTIGGVQAANLAVVSNTQITCTTPSGTGTGLSVVVTTPGGSNAGNTLFSYTSTGAAPVVTAVYPSVGAGNTLVAITGSGFTGATAVNFGTGSAPVQSFTVVNDTQINAYVAFHTAGTRGIYVTTPGGTSSGSVIFTYGPTEIASIAANPDLPNPFLFGVNGDGAAVTTKAQWALKQFELRESWASYWVGHIPPPSPVNYVSTAIDATVAGTQVRHLQVNLSTGPGGVIKFGINFYIPLNAGPGPFPILMNANWAWSPLLAAPSSTYSASLGPAAINTLCNRGYILAEQSSDQFSLDYQDTNPIEGIFTLTTPLSQLSGSGVNFGGPGDNGAPSPPSNQCYAAYGQDRNQGPTITYPPYITAGLNAPPSGPGGVSAPDVGSQGWWLWGFERCIDYIMTLVPGNPQGFTFVNTAGIATTGISHNTGPPFGAAAYDTRIAACCISQGIGIYSGSRVGGDLDSNSGVVGGTPVYPSDNSPVSPDGENLPQNSPRSACRYLGPAVTPTGVTRTVFQNYERISSDTNTLMAMIAPRGFVNQGFLGSNGIDSPRACAQKMLCGQTAWTALGANTTFCQDWWTDSALLSSNGHELSILAYTGILNFLDFYLKSIPLPADVTTVGSKAIWSTTRADFNNKASLSGAPINGSTLTSNTACGFTWSTPTLT